MKAIVFDQYGPPSSLKLKEVPKPEIEPDEILVKIKATTINDFDWSLVRGKPYIYRLLFGLTKPKYDIPGIELAGEVEEIGSEVDAFSVGDRVYGDTSDYKWGTLAEYIAIRPSSVVKIPPFMSFEEAAATPHASMLAYQSLVDIAKIKPGQKILMNGAGGGMGTFGLQIAKTYGAAVTGVDSGDKLKMMEEIGFDKVLDYKAVDFTRSKEKYDIILDAKSTRFPTKYKRVLVENGIYVSVGGYLWKILLIVMARSIFRANTYMLALKPNQGLEEVGKLFETGKIKPVIDGPYKLEEVPELFNYFGEGRHTGKIVISI